MRTLLLVLMIPLLLVACNRDNVTDLNRNDDGSLSLTASVSEAEVNTTITTILEAMVNPLLRDPSVDLQAGKIVISGEHDLRNGGGRVSGTVELALSVNGARLVVTVLAVNIEGIDANDEQIARMNERLTDALANRIAPAQRTVAFESVTITDSAIEFTIRR